MTTLSPPPQTRTIGTALIAGKPVAVTADIAWFRYWVQGLYDRGGGAIALSNTELAALITALDATVDDLAAAVAWTEVEIDFGSAPVYGAEFTITDAAITAASKVQVLPCGKAATGRTADDWAWDGAAFAANPGAGSATCYAHFLPGPVVGLRKVQYSVGA